ncbi:MAG: hypothetical protein CL521_00705 [Actinobacteria bacterium]|nr:hypothetical protein [Actinomycetota bacterium]
MIHDIIQKIQASINQSQMKPERKAAVSELLEQLRAELDTLSQDHPKDAAAMAQSTATHASDILNGREDEQYAQSLREQLARFSTDHPQLVKSIDLFCRTLSRLGI